MSEDLFQTVDQYIADTFSRDDEALAGVELSLREAGIHNISVSSSQGKLLHLLARLCGARRILEIGTLAGYSTIWLARALPAAGRLVTIEYESRHAQIARRNIARAGVDGVVEIRVGKAVDVLEALHREKPAPFDMVFIDADKVPYVEYFQWALKLSRPGTLIVADNVIRGGKVLGADGDASVDGARRFLKTLAVSSGVSATVLQTVGAKGHDGMALALVTGS
jgi:caffeoyl-CoA O-methyltransferase